MIRFFVFFTVLLLVLTTAMLFITRNRIENAPQNSSTAGDGVALIGGNFSLKNQDGVAVNDGDYRGKVMMVFFGFTHCPDVCPTTAAGFTKILELLGDKANAVAPIFITVDPERDVPAVLKEYLSNFDKRIVGLTGTGEQIKQVTSVYKAYFSKTKNTTGDETVDHSGFIYVMDKNGAYVQHFSYDTNPQEIADAVSNLLK